MKVKIFSTSKNNVIRYRLINESLIGEQDLIIIVHGFKGFMDWGFFPTAAEYFASKGFPVLSFNFSHNGVGEDLLNFSQLDKFALNTYSLEVDELGELIDAFGNNYFGKRNKTKVNLIGHSRGGLSVIINSQNDLVRSFVTWAGISKIDRFSKRQKDEWRKTGSFGILNTRTNQMMNLSTNMLEDIELNSENKLNIKKVLELNNKPFLILQGEQDLAVKVEEAQELKRWAGDNAKVEMLPATGHTFDIKHPFEELTENFSKVLNKTNNFFKEIKL